MSKEDDMKKFFKLFFCLLIASSTIIFSLIAYAESKVEEEYFVSDIKKLSINCGLPVSINSNEKISRAGAVKNKNTKYNAELKLFNVFPVANTDINIISAKSVDVLGTPFGIKIYTDGVLVTSLKSFYSDGVECCPAKEAGLKAGDYIITVNGVYVYSNKDMKKIVNSNKDLPLKFVYSRDGKRYSGIATAKISDTDNAYHIGAWVRDSSAGIGTLTFYDNSNNVVAGLGHGICDSDTGKLMSVSLGSIVPAQIVDIEKGTKSTTGELCGRFLNSEYTNSILNSERGIYGYSDSLYTKYKTMQVANHSEIEKGKAYILTTVSDTQPNLYECEIIELKTNTGTKNIVIKVTDKDLISKTGGILQGMSGSPLLQNGKLIGAVTHVLVDDPTKGYGIFAENMLETARSVEQFKEAG